MYPGSIVDVSQLQYMLEKSAGYGYKRVGFILDRDIFPKVIFDTWINVDIILSS